MRLFIIIIVPVYLCAQVPDYPDTLTTVPGKIYPCRIKYLNESRIELQYGDGRDISAPLTGVGKVYVKNIGIVYSKASGFTIERARLNRLLEARRNRLENKPLITDSLDIDSVRSVDYQSRWTLLIENGNLISINQVPELSGDSLIILLPDTSVAIGVASVEALHINKKSRFGSGAVIGSTIGFLGGVIIYVSTYEKPKSSGGWNFHIKVDPDPFVVAGIAGGLVGFVVGGLIGSAAGKDEDYDLSGLALDQKIQILNLIIQVDEKKETFQ